MGELLETKQASLGYFNIDAVPLQTLHSHESTLRADIHKWTEQWNELKSSLLAQHRLLLLQMQNHDVRFLNNHILIIQNNIRTSIRKKNVLNSDISSAKEHLSQQQKIKNNVFIFIFRHTEKISSKKIPICPDWRKDIFS